MTEDATLQTLAGEELRGAGKESSQLLEALVQEERGCTLTHTHTLNLGVTSHKFSDAEENQIVAEQ